MLGNSIEPSLSSMRTLGSLSTLIARSFESVDELVRAILVLLTDQFGMRTSFMTEIMPSLNRNRILSVYNLPGGCNLSEGIDLPLHETFCSVLSSTPAMRILTISDVRIDETFNQHPAAIVSPHIGSFVGVPIVLRNGQFYGTLCVIDPEPQETTPAQKDLLVVLGRFVATQIDHEHERLVRTEIEAERDRLFKEAQETVREREALLAITSHELKNPLTSLMGHVQLLQRHLSHNHSIDPRDIERISIIEAQTKRLSGMLTELLDVSQLDTGTFAIASQSVDLAALVRQTLQEMYTLYAGYTVSFEEPKSAITVNGDSLRLMQVIRNLLSNAIKYTSPGGKILITVTRTDNEALLQIQDTGIGISATELPNLFRRFYRAHHQDSSRSANGFGIGLYVVKEIVTRHNGTITVTSTEGVGSTFTIRIPLASS